MDIFIVNVEKDTVDDVEGNKQGLVKEAHENTCMDISRFFYENGHAFNVASNPLFVNMLRSIGNYGRDLKEPTTHELNTTFFMAKEAYTQSIVDEVRKYMDSNMSVHYVGCVEGYEKKTVVKLPRKQSVWHSVLKLSSSSIRFNDNIRRAAVASGRHQTLPTKLLAIEPHIQNCVKPTFRVSSFTPSPISNFFWKLMQVDQC
ncbi:hypothetical protein LWI28_012931 [Acer negundo]|uniref:Uncharacterized protein n=1 Tax=Acer negundo TaxID=4023 RepID=A0AAD5IA10_ACENE|nr:hypothetical protein LWI28_012931 [Acer negundo]